MFHVFIHAESRLLCIHSVMCVYTHTKKIEGKLLGEMGLRKEEGNKRGSWVNISRVDITHVKMSYVICYLVCSIKA